MSLNFHLFLDLPYEIRERIWKLTIRSDEPGVHYFAISANDSRTPSKHILNGVITNANVSNIILSAPSWVVKSTDDIPLIGTKREQSQTSWYFKNPSTYVLDSGLWTACRESSEIIRKHYRLKYWQDVRCSSSSTRLVQPMSMMPEMLRFRDGNLKDQYTTIRPYKDLFILQPDSWDFIWYGLRHQPLAARRGGTYGLVNLAIEYNPRWHNGRPRLAEMAQRVIDAIINAHAFPIWVIDYSIKASCARSHIPPEIEQIQGGVSAFYGQGRRFV
ncbi:hypothetical protein ACLX1H_003629 [Fusarium chlamydosporum]